MVTPVAIGDQLVGPGHPVYVIGEIGINHNGDLAIAKELIDVAASAGCQAVKFQKRTPELCVPEHQRNILRETPWGTMTYMDYRERVEFGVDDYAAIAAHAKKAGIHWFASCWDTESVTFMEQFDPVAIKAASASITNAEIMDAYAATGRPIILSSGMSTIEEIDGAVDRFDRSNLLLAHATSTYPCPPEELNLRMIGTLTERYQIPIGYSGHETGLQTTVAACVLGAHFVERHITLDRAMWGSDQAASVEPGGLHRLVRDIRVIERALGDGVKQVYASELPARKKLRGV